MKRNSIEFSEDGYSFKFLFSDGRESAWIYSKEAGYISLNYFADKEIISIIEYEEMLDALLRAENLEWSNNEPKLVYFYTPYGLVPIYSIYDSIKNPWPN